MKILIGADTYYPGVDGSSYFTQRLAAQLKKRGHNVLVVAPSTKNNSEITVHNSVDCVGIFSWPTLFHKDYRFCPPYLINKKIREVFDNFCPDVVHIQGHFVVERAVANEAQKRRIPLMATNHFMPDNLVHYGHFPKRIKDYVIKFMWQDFLGVFKKIAVVTTPTQTGADVLKKIGLPQPVIPLSCGIDLVRFNSKNNGDYLRERFSIPPVSVLLTVGRLAPEKNVDLILKALALLPRESKIHLVVVGGGMQKNNLKKLAGELGITDKVTFTGFLPDEDMAAMYTLAHVFVTAGEVELQSLVTMEAMATALPVIAIRALALPELVHHEENGFLFELGGTEQLASYIKKLFDDSELHQQMSQKSLGIIATHDITKTITAFEKLYNHILLEKTP